MLASHSRLKSLVLVVVACQTTVAGEVDRAKYQQAVSRGLEFLRSSQAEDGSYTKRAGIGVTALATTAMLRHGRSLDDPAVAKALEFLAANIRPDGGIYSEGSFYRNYETALAVLCFAEANENGRYDKTIAGADKFLKGLQWDATEMKELDDPNYGGAGYGQSKRADLSNTAFLVEALRAAGNGPNDEAVQKALIFVSRCQNLESEHNTTPFAGKNPDGGFYYTCAEDGSSEAGKTANGGLRSYGAMTYAGLKSMLYAGVGPDDPRVKAAVTWIQMHYDLDSNPGVGSAGLYYYYHLFAKALDTLGTDTIESADGQTHDWRQEMVAELAARQQENGSWLNTDNDRWLEGDPRLVTAYALLALAHCQPETE